MEKLKALKEKHKVPSTEELNELIRTRIPRMRDNLKYKEQQLSEINTKIQELKYENTSLEESLNAEEHILSVKSNEYLLARDKLKELEADRNKLMAEVHQLETQKNYLKNKKPSLKDEETLRNGQMKLKYYRQFTGINWDYGAPEETIKGYVTNGKDHIHTFNYRKNEQHSSKLEDELWKEVAKGTKRTNLLESECKENSASNN